MKSPGVNKITEKIQTKFYMGYVFMVRTKQSILPSIPRLMTDPALVCFQNGADDPYCREALWLEENGSYNTSAPLHGTVAYMNQIRNWAIQQSSTFTTTKNYILNYSDDQISMKKDVVITIMTFAGTGQASGTYTTDGAGYTAGASVVDLVSCTEYTASSSGEVTANVGGGEMVVLMTAAFISGSTMCGY